MAATIQNIELPKLARARDTSSGWQTVGSNLITNGDFTGLTVTGDADGESTGSWKAFDGVVLGSNIATWDGSQTGSGNSGHLDQASAFGGVQGSARFRVTVTVAATTSTVTLFSGSWGSGNLATGTHTFDIDPPSGAGSLHIAGSSTFVGTVDSVSIYELENFNNNNHGQIYSGRALEFDGVSDHLSLTQTDISTGAWTVGAWININALPDTMNVFNGGSGTRASNNIAINSDGEMAIYDYGGSGWQNAATVLNLSTWYRVLWVYDGAGVLTFYLNGVADGTASLGTSLINDDLVAQYIGTRNGSDRFWDGMMSNVQTWDAAFTQSDVTYDYLNPEQTALNNSGTALTESNLKLWYPMQDGHRGQQSYILDGANTGLGDEMVFNGDFSNGDTGWVKAATSSATQELTADGLRMYSGTASDNSNRMSETASTMSGKEGVTYVLKLTATDFVSLATGSIRLDGVYDSDNVISFNAATTEVIFVAYRDFTHFQFFASGHSDYYTVNNVSLKAINDKHHAATVFHGDELVTNGDCEVTDPTTVTINSVAFTLDDATYDDSTEQANGGSKSLKITADSSSVKPEVKFLDGSDMGLVTGRTYIFSMDVYLPAGLAMDQVRIKVMDNSGTQVGESYTTTTGSWVNLSIPFVNDDIVSLRVFGYNGGAAVNNESYYIDNVSVKEVGTASGWTDADQQLHIPQTALQSYNELAWFDGTVASNGYVALDATINTADNDWSLSFWVLHSASGQNYEFLLGGSDTRNIALYKNGVGRYLFYRAVGDVYHILSDAVIPENEWIHVVITATADTSITAYINGVAQTANSDMSDTELTLLQLMSGFANSSYSVLGTVNEISYYNDILTAAEALDLFNDGKGKSALEASGSAGLVNYWRNNGLSEWKDLKGSNDGNTSAGVVETILIPQGIDSSRDSQGFIMNKQKDTSSLNLTNGFDDPYVDLGSEIELAVGDAGSFMMWLKPDHLVNNYFIGADAGNESARIASSIAIVLRTVGSSLTFDVADGDIVVGEWFHFAASKDTDNVWSIYIDGQLNGNAASDTEDNDKYFAYEFLGARRGTSNSFNGQFDGALIYESALSQPEVERNYKATKGSHRN